MEKEDNLSVTKSSHWQHYLLFAIFGGASSWYATSLCWMELPIFQRYFGLKLSNRLEIGYNLGTIPAALYVLIRARWQRNKPLLEEEQNQDNGSKIWILLAIQTIAIGLLCIAIPGSYLFCQSLLVTTQMLGGTVGYMAQFIAVPYLMQHENELVGAFWAGDSATSVIAALVALLQRPDDQPPRFQLFIYMLACGPPILLASCFAFFYIQRYGIGRLEENIIITDSICSLNNNKDPKYKQTSSFSVTTTHKEIITLPNEHDIEEEEDEHIAPKTRLLVEHVSPQPRGINNPLPKQDDYQKVTEKTQRWYAQRLTWLLAFVVFWSQYADWGIGDGIFPYACANRGRAFVERCEMWSNELSLAAQFAGIALASKIRIRPKQNLHTTLWGPTILYSFFFAFLLYMFWTGEQYRPRQAHFFFDDRTVVLIMGLLRFLGPFTRTVVPRLIQPLYPKSDHEDIPLFFGILGILGNVLGSATATIMIKLRYNLNRASS